MQSVLRQGALVLLTAGLAGLGVSGCESERATREPLPPSVKGPGSILSASLLDHAGLKTGWEQMLPLKEGEKLVSVTLLGNRLYLRSDQNYLWSLDRVKGDIIFSRSVAAPGIPLLGLVAYEDNLITVIANKLVELDINSGKERRVSNLGVSIVAPPARNNQFFYVPGAKNRLHVFDANNLVHLFPVAADDDSLITTVVADDTFIAFGTQAGDLVGMAPDAPTKLWQFKAPEAVASSLVRDGSSFYFASVDTNVYRVDVAEGKSATLAWKYQCEAILDRAPLVTNDFVYQYAVGRGVSAIAKQTGKAAWSMPEGLDLLAEAGNRAYVLTKDRTLTVMDNVTGKRLFSVNFAPVAHHAANTMDARIYIMDGTGRVACLEPAM